MIKQDWSVWKKCPFCSGHDTLELCIDSGDIHSIECACGGGLWLPERFFVSIDRFEFYETFEGEAIEDHPDNAYWAPLLAAWNNRPGERIK